MKRDAVSCLAFLGVALAAGGTGCGRTEADHPPCYPVRGTVTYNGKPATGAIVRFWPAGAGPTDWKVVKPEAMVGEDGSFQLLSYTPGDGAPVGEYAVTVRWSGRDAPPGPDLLGERFSDPKRPVLKVTVKETGTEVPPIELKGPPLAARNPTKGGGAAGGE
jgi:hypothetical protein